MRARSRAAAVLVVASTGLPAAALASPTGPPSSSYATVPRGLAAYATLLEEFGHDVSRLREPLRGAALDPATTVVLLDPPSLSAGDAGALRQFVADGGRLVAGGTSPYWLTHLLDDPPEWDDAATSTQYGVTDLSGSGIAGVETAGEGRWSDTGETTVVAGAVDDALAVEVGLGEGTAVLLADASPLQNRLLDQGDNAAFALALAGDPGPVVFVEVVHGFGPPRGLSAFPARWRWTFLGFTLAAALWMWARGKRLGPPEEAERVLPPPRRAYVEALAATLARARRQGGGSG